MLQGHITISKRVSNDNLTLYMLFQKFCFTHYIMTLPVMHDVINKATGKAKPDQAKGHERYLA